MRLHADDSCLIVLLQYLLHPIFFHLKKKIIQYVENHSKPVVLKLFQASPS